MDDIPKEILAAYKRLVESTLSTGQVAIMAGCHRNMVQHHIKAGHLPATKTPIGYRILPHMAERWIANRKAGHFKPGRPKKGA